MSVSGPVSEKTTVDPDLSVNTGGFSLYRVHRALLVNNVSIISIKENYLFSKLYAKGKRCVAKNVTVYAMPNFRGRDSRLGITASKKLGIAVQRTRVRRLVRESYRLILKEKSFSRPVLVVVVARSACFEKGRKMDEVKKDLLFAFGKLGLFGEDKA